MELLIGPFLFFLSGMLGAVAYECQMEDCSSRGVLAAVVASIIAVVGYFSCYYFNAGSWWLMCAPAVLFAAALTGGIFQWFLLGPFLNRITGGDRR